MRAAEAALTVASGPIGHVWAIGFLDFSNAVRLYKFRVFTGIIRDISLGRFPARGADQFRKDVCMDQPRMPTGLKTAGKTLWKQSISEIEFASHELALLEEACRMRDRVKDLDAAVLEDGVMIASSQGKRLHPGIAEARQQRLALARMLVTMKIPELNKDLPVSRGVRSLRG